MGRVSVQRISVQELDAQYNPFQSKFWAGIKKKSQWEPLALRVQVTGPDTGVSEPQVHISTLLVLVRKLSLSFCIAYIPFGPQIHDVPMPNAQYLRELARAIKPMLPLATICVRFDLPWNTKSSTVADPLSGRALHTCKESVQPEGTVIISLQKGYEAVRSGYRERAIRNIRKSIAKGVTVREWDKDEQIFGAWYEVYLQTAKRDGFTARDEQYLRQFLLSETSKSPSSKRATAKNIQAAGTHTTERDRVSCNLYVAFLERKLVGGAIIMESPGTAVYLFGASLRIDGVSCSYVLQDYAIAKSCEQGRIRYDLYGISGPGNRGSHLEGLRLFKRAFGGDVFYRHPSIDYVYHILPWGIYSWIEHLRYRAIRMRQPKRISQQFSVSLET